MVVNPTRCPFCRMLFLRQADRQAHIELEVRENERFRRQIHGEVDAPGPVDRFLADLRA